MIKKIIALKFLTTYVVVVFSNDSVLTRRSIDAQIQNQEAQAKYYSNQAKKSNLNLDILLPVFGALIVAGISFLGILKQLRETQKTDREKWDKAQLAETARLDRVQKEDNQRNIRLAGADLMGKTAIAAHNMTWVLWIAKNDPDGFTYNLIKEHDEKMNKLYPKIVDAQVVLAAHNKKLYYKTRDIIKEMYHYDGELGRLAVDLRNGDKKAIKLLGDMWRTVNDFSLEIPDKFANILESTSTKENKSAQSSS